MLTKVLLDEPRLFVTYGMGSVFSGDEPVDSGAAWLGQENGLCGAAVPGQLELRMATHTGWVPLRVELHDGEPPVDDAWDEIVEALFRPAHGEVHLEIGDGDLYRLALPPGAYMVRYNVRGVDGADVSEDAPDSSYLLQFWPAPLAPDRIVKESTSWAAWHHRHRPADGHAQAGEDDLHEWDDAEVGDRWGDRVPNKRLREVEGLALPLISKLDIDLEFTLSQLPDQVHRRVAAWASLRCLEQTGLIDRPDFAPAVAALRRGERVPAPFDEPAHINLLFHRSPPARTSVPVPPDGDYEESPEDWAASTVFRSALDDSLAAVLEVLVGLAFVYGRDGYQQAFADTRAAFPELAEG
ncbi:hypothetical protein AMIS_37800 [Actinoplanes missouriensis 431]|uniref:Uncharacterized protein n=1 Tax=Actinoplanes missouriensis (strain ATCC 14538 / DSM 43046 / CBS 188.64 / JCM 3121 / NBRC 102363 / NCIMB 12654 / NRRL B-3342 / UNCC 431) TaxID=512565 RepID=I0H7L3_ACTM4|nr:hypothetical protein [Actinoplanes missouriensis]BAL89000.1 hypothetical protein AMIS_37800 [Actinoplanes missouriensis 431]